MLFELVASFIARKILKKINFEKNPQNGQKLKGTKWNAIFSRILRAMKLASS